jgi:hypothetical protein
VDIQDIVALTDNAQDLISETAVFHLSHSGVTVPPIIKEIVL